MIRRVVSRFGIIEERVRNLNCFTVIPLPFLAVYLTSTHSIGLIDSSLVMIGNLEHLEVQRQIWNVNVGSEVLA